MGRVAVSPAWVSALSGSLAVALGAFGAHALKAKVSPEYLKTWETAVLYHLVNSCAMLGAHATEKAVAAAAAGLGGKGTQVESKMSLTTKLFLSGTVLFSGSLYGIVLTNVKKLGIITPFGGVLMICGWASFMF